MSHVNNTDMSGISYSMTGVTGNSNVRLHVELVGLGSYFLLENVDKNCKVREIFTTVESLLKY
jgi:hypothetical protein